METLTAVCNKCQRPLATFANLWTRLSDHFSPVLDAIGEVQITTKGPARIAKFKKSRTSVQFLGPSGGTVELKVRRNLRLQRCSGSKPEKLESAFHDSQHHDLAFDDDDGGSVENDSVDLGSIQTSLEAQQEQIERIGNAAHQKVSRFDDVISRIDSRVQKLNDSIIELQNEINGSKRDIETANADISEVKLTIRQTPATAKVENKLREACSAIINLETLCEEARNETDLLHKGLQVTKDDVRRLENAMTNLRQELVTAKKAARDSLSAAKDNTKELTSLKAELRKLKEGMNQNRPQPYESTSQSLMPRELDILTNNITKIGNRASLVDSLQMEMELLKSRVQRLEANVEFPALPNHEHPLKLSHPEESLKGLETTEDPGSKIAPVKPDQNQSDNSSDENEEPSFARSHPGPRKRKTPSGRSRRQESAKSPRLTRSVTIDKRTIKKQ
ncbi:hypothetical protein CSOJ01_02441 [Colletotrichum sojae]|uniref:Uncharacterized protein n=1 Tax=Colletotrichum sojae TaxID=2175907 RepID=A0A8H6N232_9PEZI|nr:hypothetical protein CSOJ01_02441 [Colletotrichum sojae]